jgi:hypothetical protein
MDCWTACRMLCLPVRVFTRIGAYPSYGLAVFFCVLCGFFFVCIRWVFSIRLQAGSYLQRFLAGEFCIAAQLFVLTGLI